MLDNLIYFFKKKIKISIYRLYNIKVKKLDINYTNKKLIGDVTFLMFDIKKKIHNKSYNQIGNEIGEYILNHTTIISQFIVINGFINFCLKDNYFIKSLSRKINKIKHKKKSIMIEFSSPNTNKPLHLGHLRNICLGSSLSNLFSFYGYKVLKAQIINDRGIHICQSMLSWMKYGDNTTPNTQRIKGDHFVGKYYTLFHKKLKEEIDTYLKKGYSQKAATNKSILIQESNNLLLEWERNNKNILNIWKKMNEWVYAGFKETYKRLNINFDVEEYESKIYQQGKAIIFNALKNKIVYQKSDKSIWIDLNEEKLGEKLLLRSNGTSLYITQDIATIINRFNTYPIDYLIFVVGKEQEHYFNVLFTIIKKLKIKNYDKLLHMSYEMVYLPTGKMKSREGVNVNADFLMNDITYKLKSQNKNLHNNEIITQAALKYFFLKIDPSKKIIFNINHSIDFKGNTGPYIQYTYVRINSIKNKMKINHMYNNFKKITLNIYEKKIIKLLNIFYYKISLSIKHMNPSIIANYAYDLSKCFNEYYENVKIIDIYINNKTFFKLKLAFFVGKILKKIMCILGIYMPKYM
jgi:arginyl-tRNA synthetase